MLRLLNDPADACDVTQEVFLKVFRKIGAFREGKQPEDLDLPDSRQMRPTTTSAGLAAIAARKWVWRGGEEDSLSYSQRLSDPGRSPYECVADQERHALIEDALGRLNPTFRSAVVLRDIEELSYDEDRGHPSGGARNREVADPARARGAQEESWRGRLEPEPAPALDATAGRVIV